jgi:poly(beta-D-mannuronate) lyase
MLVRTVAELQEALRAAQPGDAVVLADGRWENADIVFDRVGEPDRPVLLRAETPGMVLLTGRSRIRIGGQHLTVEGLLFRDGYYPGDVVSFRSSRPAHYCRLTQCAIVDYSPPDKSSDSKWVSLYGSSNRVDHCFFAGKTNAGATMVVWLPQEESPNHHVIHYNWFGPRPPLGVNGGETIRVGDSSTSMQASRTLVEDNYFEQCNGEIEIISNKSCENTYRSNTFESCEGTLTLRHGNRCLVEGNFFIGNGLRSTGGVRIIGEDHRVVNNYFDRLTGTGTRAAISLMNGVQGSPLSGYFQVKRVLVAFNTVVMCAAPLVIGAGAGDDALTEPPQEVKVANNILWATRSPAITVVDPASQVEYLANLNSDETDPALARSSDGLWRPAAASPAVGAAIGAFPEVAEDFDGQPRPEAKDIGCDQTSQAPRLRWRWRKGDLGPGWLRDGV